MSLSIRIYSFLGFPNVKNIRFRIELKKIINKSKQIEGRESIQRSHLYVGAAVLQTVSIGIGVFFFF